MIKIYVKYEQVSRYPSVELYFIFNLSNKIIVDHGVCLSSLRRNS